MLGKSVAEAVDATRAKVAATARPALEELGPEICILKSVSNEWEGRRQIAERSVMGEV